MEILIVTKDNIQFSKTKVSELILEDEQIAGDLIMTGRFEGIDNFLIQDYQIPGAFFQLKTRLAGEILQKFSTYNAFLFIVGDYSKYEGISLNQFITESNKTGRVNFVSSEDEAMKKMEKR